MRCVILVLLFAKIQGSYCQEANIQALFSIDGYNWNRTPALDSVNTHVHSGNAVLNPSIGLSVNLPIAFETQLIISSHITVGLTSLSLGKQLSFGSLMIPNMIGIGFYAGDGVFTQILYGYQFNFLDLYGVNEEFTRKELRYETHVLECSVGFGDDKNELLFAPYFRYGINNRGAHSINLGLRLGLGFVR
jgi:hypothetical protein